MTGRKGERGRERGRKRGRERGIGKREGEEDMERKGSELPCFRSCLGEEGKRRQRGGRRIGRRDRKRVAIILTLESQKPGGPIVPV